MRHKTFSLLFVMVFLLPVFAGAVSEKDFEVQTTENMINLCTVAPDDPLYHHAINFCHGYPLKRMSANYPMKRLQLSLLNSLRISLNAFAMRLKWEMS